MSEDDNRIIKKLEKIERAISRLVAILKTPFLRTSEGYAGPKTDEEVNLIKLRIMRMIARAMDDLGYPLLVVIADERKTQKKLKKRPRRIMGVNRRFKQEPEMTSVGRLSPVGEDQLTLGTQRGDA